MMEWMQPEGSVWWQYAILFAAAAAPWLEVFLVVPLGVAWGLNPIGVAVTGFIGNYIPILLIAFFFRQLSAWNARRKAKRAAAKGLPPEASDETESKKHRRARRIWEKYGVPGLALLALILVGTDIAAVLALTFGSSRRWVMIWMTVSLFVWTILLTIGSVYGLDYVGWLQGAERRS